MNFFIVEYPDLCGTTRISECKITDFLPIIQIFGKKYISLQQKLNYYEKKYLYYCWCKT